MSRRYYSLVVCGLACLTTGLSTNSRGSDFQTIDSAGMANPVDGGLAAAPQMMHPKLHDLGNDDSHPDHRMMLERIESGTFGPSQRDIIPPGTLGRTYIQVSHPVPLDKHPRTGMLAVKDHSKVPYLTVGTMGGVKMKNGIWLFESSRPLDPGACQIVRVEARETPQDVEPYDNRFVRLIPGRIVYLDF